MLRPLAVSTFSLLIAFAFPDGAADNRKPVPSKTDVDAAALKVREVFRSDFAKTKDYERIAFANRLLELATKTNDDVPVRYAILKEAEALADKAGDAVLFLSIARRIAADFRVSLREACGDHTLTAALAGRAVAKEQIQALVDLLDIEIDAGDFASALRWVHGLDAIVRKSALPDLIAVMQVRSKSVRSLRDEFAELEAARKKLASDPADKSANACVGRFECFVRRNWAEGLAQLLLGEERKFADAATKDIGAGSGEAAAKLLAAEAWIKIAANVTPLEKASIEKRALDLCREALPDLKGLDQIAAENHVKELSKASLPNDVPAERKTVAPKTKSDFVSLFNGKDLRGWKVYHNLKQRWHVEDGVIIGTGPAPFSLLGTDRRDFENFHLRVETMRSEGGNSCIELPNGLRTTISGTKPPVPTQKGLTGDLLKSEDVLFRGTKTPQSLRGLGMCTK